MLRNYKGSQLMLGDYNRHLMIQRMKNDKVNKKFLHKDHIKWMKLGITGNTTLMKHFRNQNIIFG